MARSYLAASMAVVMFCCHFSSRDTSPRICQWSDLSNEVTETARYLGSKTPYPLLRHVQPLVQVSRNLESCQAVKVRPWGRSVALCASIMQ